MNLGELSENQTSDAPRGDDEESRPAIEEAAKSESFRLRRSAKMALKRLDRAAKTAREIKPRAEAPAGPPRGEKDEPTF